MSHPFQEDITPNVTTGHDVVHEELGKWWNTGVTAFNVGTYDNATFDGRFDEARIDANSAGGIIVVPPGEYTSSGLGTVTSQRVSIVGPAGPQATRIRRVGGSTLLTFAPNPMGVDQMGGLSGVRLIGDGTAGVKAVRCVDCGVLPDFSDVVISDFSGYDSIGVDIENVNIWNERGSGRRLSLEHNAIGMRMTGGGPSNSLFYHRWTDLRMNVGGSQIGLQLKGTALLQGGLFNILCNIDGNDGVALDLLDTAVWGGHVYLSGEQTSGTGGIARRLAPGALWAASGEVTMTGCTDSGPTANFWTPFGQTGAHIMTLFPAVPSVTIGAAAGTGAPAPTITGNDTRMLVACGTGTGTSNGHLLSVTYQAPYSQVAYPSITPFGVTSSLFRPFISAYSATGFSISLGEAPTASMAAGSLAYIVQVSG